MSNHINAVTGNITKTYRESFFKRFNLNDDLADALFNEREKERYISVRDENGKDHDYINNDLVMVSKKEVIIVQMVVVGDMEVLAELIYKEDYDKVFEGKKTE